MVLPLPSFSAAHYAIYTVFTLIHKLGKCNTNLSEFRAYWVNYLIFVQIKRKYKATGLLRKKGSALSVSAPTTRMNEDKIHEMAGYVWKHVRKYPANTEDT